MKLGSASLLACTSYATDLIITSCLYNGWKVGLLSNKLAQLIAPEMAETMLFAGLLHDIGTVGILDTHDRQNVSSISILNYTATKGAGLVGILPGLQLASDCIKYMYKPYESAGIGDDKYSENVFIGSQILRLTDIIDAIGYFSNSSNAEKVARDYRNLEKETGHSWSDEIWAQLWSVLQDKEFCAGLSDSGSLTEMLVSALSEAEITKKMDSEKGNLFVFYLISSLVDIKDVSTAGHSMRVAKAAQDLASRMGLPEEECSKAFYAGLIHDLGKLGLPSKIINNSGRLHEKDISLVKLHASGTLAAMSCIPQCQELVDIAWVAAHDHEFYNGKGYPDSLAGENIPLISRIIAVADAYDAMITHRDYRILTPRAALLRLRQGSGSQFDPAVVNELAKAQEPELAQAS